MRDELGDGVRVHVLAAELGEVLLVDQHRGERGGGDLQPGLVAARVALVPGLVATWIWFMLVGRIGAVRAATFHFLNPFFGVLIASALLGERIGVWDIVGVVIAAVGILAVQMSKARA